ncbi:MAG: hypothetical protein KY454_08705 [Actinobacteria bacterium]|nr:hypothetical protein [Actinomycetota bacterium]MBW3650834.1 hypothetical protein [Actinomycetota bacterium]
MRLLLLAGDASGAGAVDLSSGALLRVRWSVPAGPFSAYDVVEARRSWDEGSAFAADSVVAWDPVVVGRMRGRRVARLLKPLVHPPNAPLLGAVTPTVPYWTLRGDQPSLTLVEPDGGPVVERDSALRLRCRFRWRRLDHDLPLDDPALEEQLSHPTATSLAGATLARALGWKPDRLLVALTPPRDGLCHKVVGGLLPRP